MFRFSQTACTVAALSAVLLIGGVAIVRSAVFGADGQGTQHPSETLFPIKVVTLRSSDVAAYTIAERKGFLKEEGLRLQRTGETQPSLVVPALLRGAIDVFSFAPNTLAVARAAGASITGVSESGIEPVDPAIDPKFRHIWWFINPEKHPEIHCVADLAKLNGRLKFATGAANVGVDFEGRSLVERAGLARERFDWVNIPDIQAIQALRQGLVDVSAVHPPFYAAMEEAGARRIADSSETGLGAAGGVTYWTFRDDFIQHHSKEVTAWTRALRRAQRWANANPSDAISLTGETIGTRVTAIHYFSESPTVNEPLALPWIQDLEASGTIPRGRLRPADLVTHAFEPILDRLDDHERHK